MCFRPDPELCPDKSKQLIYGQEYRPEVWMVFQKYERRDQDQEQQVDDRQQDPEWIEHQDFFCVRSVNIGQVWTAILVFFFSLFFMR